MKDKLPAFSDWNELYRKEKAENMPWFSQKLDHDLDQALNKIKIANKKILSLGEGPGTQAIALAKRGCSVTATDISEAAVRKAEERAKEEGVKIKFVLDDIISTKLKDTFPFIFDRGCFHVLGPDERRIYVKNVHKLLQQNGVLLLKCFSWKEKMKGGPYRFAPEELKAIFEDCFDVMSIKETHFEGTLTKKPKALLVIMRKKGR